jgi:LPS sulfotransferase NodH
MRKFIVLSSQRSGSTFFLRYLGSHPAVDCGEEIFIRKHHDKTYENARLYHYGSLRPLRSLKYNLGILISRAYIPIFRNRMASSGNPEDSRLLQLIDRFRLKPQRRMSYDFLDDYYSVPAGDTGARGFKLMYNQANTTGLSMKELSGRGFGIIHWIRRNALKVLISNRRLVLSGVPHSTQALPQIKIELDTGRLIRDLNIISNSIRYYRKLLAGTDCLEMYYEDFAGNEENEIVKVLDFLDVDRNAELSCDLRKITSENLEEVLSNYEEVSGVLRGTKYEEFL